MPNLDIRDTTIHYDASGTGEPTLVFVHGMCGGAWVWADQVARLSDRFECIAYDRRGHSASSAGDGDQSVLNHAADLAELIETLSVGRPIVVASSGGAVVATEFLHRRPDLVRGAVLSEPPLFSIAPAVGERLIAEIRDPIREAAERGGPQAALERFFGIVCPAMWSRLDAERKAAYMENAGLLFPTLEALGATVTLDDVAAIDVPTCVVGGAESVPEHRALAHLLADNLADARYVEFEGAGHGTYVDAPEDFAATVAAFAHEVSGLSAMD